ncbi:hypothetical protein G7066_02945 [Leucobacter coleopterorum]|uniref:Big-1 domain-containing protein n=1 Tax=Leucobacter coleopterorum TaxID=2714933 RepID=A0ABX6JWF1_9MICO|nr:invasin domain 3-containing protein [Leucobacter coleopterorum]QIM17903.1 hypothetical protein G7066_02945 [Leucobacter coleopterorum]
MIRDVTLDSIWAGGINIVQQYGNTTEPVHGLSLIDSTFSWENRYTGNAVYGIGKWDGGIARVDDLLVMGTTFKDFRRGFHYDNSVPISGDLLQFGGNSRISGNRFVNTLETSLIHGTANNDIRLTRAPAAGATVTVDHNVFSNETSWVPTGPSVLVSGGVAGSGTVAVTDNSFIGWNRSTVGQVISVASSGGPSVALDRNTFSNVGGYTETPTNSAELPGDIANPVHISNTNGNVRTAFPSAASVVPGECQVKVTVQEPQAGGSQPSYPVRVDAFAGGENGANVYLGRVQVASAADWGTDGAELKFPFALGEGKLRLQTVDALGNTSPLSRTVEVVDGGAEACGPQLWIRQAETQQDPSWSRSLEFEVMSSVPLADGALDSALNTAASSAAATVQSVRPASENAAINTRWNVTVKADSTGVVVLGVAAQSVQDREGHWNEHPANATDAPNNFVRSADPAGIAGTPGALLDASVEYRVPVRIAETTDGILTAVEGGADSDPFRIETTARDSQGRMVQAPVAAVVVHPNATNLVPDASMPDPLGDPAAQARLLPNNLAMNENDAVIDPAFGETQIAVTAINNTVVDGTRTLTLSPVLASDDPEYDGIVLDSLSVVLGDDDEPVAEDSPAVVTSNDATANGTAANSVSVTARNAAGLAVQNAVVRFAVPADVVVLDDGDEPIAGPASVTRITNAQGKATLAAGSTVAHTPFEITATVDAADRQDVVAGSPATVTFTPGAPSAAHSMLSVTPGKLTVDGEPHEAKVRVADAFGNFVTGQSVTFATDPATTVSGNGVAVSGNDGFARVTITTQKAGTVTVSATLGIEQVAESPATVSFGAGSYAAANSGVQASTEVAEANGTHEVKLEATLKDAFGNEIDGELSGVTIASSHGNVSETAYVGEGMYAATLTAAQPGSATVTVSVGGVRAAGTAAVRFVQTPSKPTVGPSNGTKVSGSADPFMTVTVRTEDGTLLASTVSDMFGRYSTSLLAAVVHDQRLNVQARDENGFVSAVAVLTIDLLAPDAPQVDPSNGWKLKICTDEGNTVAVHNRHGNTMNGELRQANGGCFAFTRAQGSPSKTECECMP